MINLKVRKELPFSLCNGPEQWGSQGGHLSEISVGETFTYDL
jgi:hypothetical protein